MKFTKRSIRKAAALVFMGFFLMSWFTGIDLPTIPPAYASASVINLKALVITCSNDGSAFYSAPYDQQIAQNMMRDWGIPFDSVDSASITSSTFWDSTNQVNKYQYAVYFGCISFSTEPSLSTTIKNAVTGAITNGTNFMFIGAGVSNWPSLFGLSALGDCPANPQSGGACGGTGTFKINHNYCGILRQQTCWVASNTYAFTGAGVPDYAMPTSTWDGVTGTEFMQASANGVYQPNTIFRNYGSNHAMIWWFGATEGPFSFYRQGWAGTFVNGEFSSTQYYQKFQPEVQLFYYALQNITHYDVRMMPWATAGSAEVFRVEDHAAICPTFTACATGGGDAPVSGMTGRGLIGEINVNLNGWSNSIALTYSSGLPASSTNVPAACKTGYTAFAQLTTTWNSRYMINCPVVNNMTFTGTGGGSNAITTSHAVTVAINDGNTTQINTLRVRVSTSATPSWTLSFKDSKGNVLWTSSAQTTNLASATWVKFSNANFSGGLTGYVNNLQGNDKLTLTVTSGTVTWTNQSSTQADWMITGRSNWDIDYVAATNGASPSFSGSKPLVPDSIRMANGVVYARDNTTVYISGVPGLFHPANINGETNTGNPTNTNVETFFNSSDWSTYGPTQVSQWKSLVGSGWTLETNGWTHAKVQSGSNDNDFVMGNGTTASTAFMTTRVTDIIDHLNLVLGAAYYVKYWAFGTSAQSYYPGEAVMATAGFTEAQLATQNGATLSYVTAGIYQTAATGAGSIYDISQGMKGSGFDAWFGTYNETRDMLGVISTHSDMNNPWNDYDMANSVKLAQQYDLSSTWFCGTTLRCFNYWNTTFYAVQHVKTFQWTSASNAITLVQYTGTSKYIDNTNLADPIVVRLPEVFQTKGFTSGVDNQTAGSISNSTASYRYYQINVGKKWTSMTFSYTEPTTTVTITTTPATTPLASSLSVDYATYSPPQTFTWYINSVHAVTALSPIGCGTLCTWNFQSWSDTGAQSHDYTVPGANPTLTATYAQASGIPSGIVRYIPITITNPNTTPDVVGTQLKLIIPWNTYNAYLDSNLENVAFFDANGHFWNSWNENASLNTNGHGIVWTKSLLQIAANSGTLTIYMGFYTLGTNNYSPTGNWGAFPSLTGTYAQYDNGIKVFPSGYWNFAGTSLPSGWVGAGYTVNNGLTIPGSQNYAYTSAVTYGLNASQILDMDGTIPTPNSNNVYSCVGYVGQNAGTTCSVNSGRDLNTWTLLSSHQATNAFGIASHTGAGVTNVDGADTTGTNVYTIYWPSSSLVAFSNNYGTASSTSAGTITSANLAIGGASSNNNNFGQSLGPFTWMRLRVYQGASYPTFSFGAGVTPITLTMAVSPGGSGTVIPATQAWTPAVVVYALATGNSGYSFSTWTCTGAGCGSGASNPISVTVNNAMTETANFALATVSQVITVTMANSAPTATVTINGCSTGGNTTFTSDPFPHTYPSFQGSCPFTLSFSNAGNMRDGFIVSSAFSATSITYTSGSAVSVTAYAQTLNTYRASPTNPNAWNAFLSITVSGTYLGATGQVECTVSTATNNGAATCAGWFDYNTQTTMLSPVPVSSNVQWVQACGGGGNQFTQTSGGNTDNCNYVMQVFNTYTTNPRQGNGPANVAVTGTLAGVSSQQVCALQNSASGGSNYGTCTGWSDYGTTVTFQSPIAISSTSQWAVSTNTGSYSPIAGGGTMTADYGKQWQVQFAVSGSGGISPSSTAFYNDTSTLIVTATANSGNRFSNWRASSGGIRFTSTTSPATVATIGGAGVITAVFLGTSNPACTAANGVQTTAFNSFSLLGIMLVAMGAVTLIGVVVLGLASGGGPGSEEAGAGALGLDESTAKVLGVVLASIMVIVGLYVFATFGVTTNTILGC